MNDLTVNKTHATGDPGRLGFFEEDEDEGDSYCQVFVSWDGLTPAEVEAETARWQAIERDLSLATPDDCETIECVQENADALRGLLRQCPGKTAADAFIMATEEGPETDAAWDNGIRDGIFCDDTHECPSCRRLAVREIILAWQNKSTGPWMVKPYVLRPCGTFGQPAPTQ